MAQRISIGVAVVCTCLAMVGCGGAPAADQPAPNPRMVSVQVDNQNSFAVEIFAYRNRNRTKVGLVGPGLVQILQFEWRAGDVRFIIDFVGSDNQRLPEIDRRDTFAADAMDSVPCILTDVNPIEAGVTLTLVIPEGLEQTQGRSRCAR